MFSLDDRISIRVGKSDIVGKLVGIDQYVLEGFDGKTTRWPSYTLVGEVDVGKTHVGETKDLFRRYWMVLWDQTTWILWTNGSAREAFAPAALLPEKSGIARIAFSGDAGPSTPTAALVQYKKGARYYCIERFAGSKVMVFAGQKITTPKILRPKK